MLYRIVKLKKKKKIKNNIEFAVSIPVPIETKNKIKFNTCFDVFNLVYASSRIRHDCDN